MTRPLILIPALATLLAGGTAFAQDTTSEAPAAETPAEDTSVLDTGEVVAAAPTAPQQEQTYVKATHGDWIIQCLQVQNGGREPCQMYQLLRDDAGGSVAEISIFSLPEGSQVPSGGTFVVPLETLLTEKLTIQVDSGQAKRYDYSFCTTVGCYARVGFTPDDIASFRRGNAARVGLVPALAPDQPVVVTMSLAGFTAAYNELVELSRAPAE